MILNRAQGLRFGLIFCLAALIYSLMAGEKLTQQSIAPHFAYLAEAWLEGRSSLAEPLPSTYDLIRYQNVWYVAQPPLPALMMLPLAAVRGGAGVPEVLFAVLVGAGSVALCDLTIGIYDPSLDRWRRAWLVVFFALGTPHGYMSALGTVWFTGQLTAVFCLWWFLLGLLWRKPWLVGLGLAGVLLARPSVILGAGLLAVGWWWLDADWRQQILTNNRTRYIVSLQVMIPILAAGLFLGWYNQARFESPLDFGYDHLIDAPNIRERRLEHGQFNPIFLPDHLYTATIRPPLWENNKLTPNPWGMGLLLTSPVMLYLVAARWERRNQLLAGAALLMLLPSLMYHNSGSAQFGYRFILDALPVLILVIASGAKRGSIVVLGALTVWSVAVHFWGFHWFYPMITGGG